MKNPLLLFSLMAIGASPLLAASAPLLPHQNLRRASSEVASEPFEAPAAPRKSGTPAGPLGEPTAADLAESPDAPFSDEMRALADSLDRDPLKIFNWVRNEIAFSPVWGSVQGGQACLENRGGNAFDTASLLVALLRVSGVHARYQTGLIEVPVGPFQSWAGCFTNPAAAASLFATAGTPGVVRRVDGTGAVRSVRLEHVWVEAWIDYVPSRGARHREGDTWVALDASFKAHAKSSEAVTPGTLDLPSQNELAAMLGSMGTLDFDNPLGPPFEQTAVNQLMGTLLAQAADSFPAAVPGTSLADRNGGIHIVPIDLPILPAAPAYRIHRRLADFAEIPAEYRHTVSIEVARKQGPMLLQFEAPLSALASHAVTIEWTPATASDASYVVAAYANEIPEALPPGSFSVIPRILIDGVEVQAGSAASWVETIKLKVSFRAPAFASAPVENTMQAGELITLAFSGHATPSALFARLAARLATVQARAEAEVPDLDLAETKRALLAAMGHYWFRFSDFTSRMMADTQDLAFIRFPSLAMAFHDMDESGRKNGIAFDIDRDFVIAMARDGETTRPVIHTLLSGVLGSMFEALVPAMFDPAVGETNPRIYVSTATMLSALARGEAGILTLHPNRYAQESPFLVFPRGERPQIETYLKAGYSILMPNAPLEAAYEEDLFGYIAFDPATGSANYLIGGLGGSRTNHCARFELMDPIGALTQTETFANERQLVASVVGQMPTGLGGIKSLLKTVLELMTKFDQQMARYDVAEQLIGSTAGPLRGMAMLFTVLELVKEVVARSLESSLGEQVGGVASRAWNLGAGTFLSVASGAATFVTADLIGRIVELESIENGIQLTPGCVGAKLKQLIWSRENPAPAR